MGYYGRTIKTECITLMIVQTKGYSLMNTYHYLNCGSCQRDPNTVNHVLIASIYFHSIPKDDRLYSDSNMPVECNLHKFKYMYNKKLLKTVWPDCKASSKNLNSMINQMWTIDRHHKSICRNCFAIQRKMAILQT